MARLGGLTLDSGPDDVAEAIVLESIRRGHRRDETIAEVSTAIQESSLNPRAVHPNGKWVGVYQQDTSYPGRGNANDQIAEFFDRLDVKRASPGASPDPFLNIFWLQQAPGRPSAQQAYDFGRKAYRDEITRHLARASAYYDRFAGGAPAPAPPPPSPARGATFWPLGAGRKVTSEFGSRAGGQHAGTDFGRDGGSAGMPVYACRGGTVIEDGPAQGYGGPDPAGWLVIDHPAEDGGGCTEYGHIIREVAKGQRVEAGQRIGHINPDPATNGGVAPHLHLSVMPYDYNPGKKIDPIPWLGAALEPEGRPAPSTPPQLPAPPAGAPVARPEFREINVIDKRAISGKSQDRRGTKIDLLLAHTSEGDGGEGLIGFMERKGVSYHYLIDNDRDGNTVWDLVDTDRASWSVLDANNRSINYVIGRSFVRWSRQEWVDNARNAIRIMAWLMVQDARKYHIEPRVIAPPYPVGPPGISDHKFVTQRLRIGDHTDMGNNFPWDLLEADVREFSGQGGPTLVIGDITLSGNDAAIVVAASKMILAMWDNDDLSKPHKWLPRGMFGLVDVPAGGVDDTIGMLLNTDANAWNLVMIVGALLGVEYDVQAINDTAEGRFPEGAFAADDEWLKARATEFAQKLQPLCGLLKPAALEPPAPAKAAKKAPAKAAKKAPAKKRVREPED